MDDWKCPYNNLVFDQSANRLILFVKKESCLINLWLFYIVCYIRCLTFVPGKNKFPNSHHCTWEVMGTVPWHLRRLLWKNERWRRWKSVRWWIRQRTRHKMRSVSGLENQLWTGNKHRDLSLQECGAPWMWPDFGTIALYVCWRHHVVCRPQYCRRTWCLMFEELMLFLFWF